MFPEIQKHSVSCSVLRQRLLNVVDFDSCRYEDITANVEKQENLAKIYTLLIEARQEIIDLQTLWS